MLHEPTHTSCYMNQHIHHATWTNTYFILQEAHIHHATWTNPYIMLHEPTHTSCYKKHTYIMLQEPTHTSCYKKHTWYFMLQVATRMYNDVCTLYIRHSTRINVNIINMIIWWWVISRDVLFFQCYFMYFVNNIIVIVDFKRIPTYFLISWNIYT